MKRYTVWLDEAQLARLKARQEATGVPVAEQIRRAIEASLKRPRKRKTRR